MEINRRAVVTAFVASVAAATVPARLATALAFPSVSDDHETINVRFLDPVYQASAWEYGETLARVYDSLWLYDDDTFDDVILIRHCPTGLTYALDPDEEGRTFFWEGLIAVRQVHPECCRPRPSLDGDPQGIIGYAAALVALHVSRIFPNIREQHKGRPIFFHYPPDLPDDGSDVDPIMTDAPSIWLYERPENALSTRRDYAETRSQGMDLGRGGLAVSPA